MEKYRLELELRYRKVINNEDFYQCPKIVIGIYDTWEEAEKVGNNIITNCLSNHFEVRADDKFMKRYAFSCPNNLVTNTCYSKGKPNYFFNIIKMVMSDDVETFVTNAIKEYEEYKLWEKNNEED